jgi:exosortase/archaeosortase family protein
MAKRFSAQPAFFDRSLLKVALRFAAYFLLFDVAIVAVDLFGGWRPMLQAWASVSAGIARLLGVHLVLAGTQIGIGTRTLSIDLPCSAIFIAALFISLVLAYPVSWKARLLGLAIGLPAILLANVLRLVAVEVVQATAPAAFPFVHDYLFEVGMVFVTLAAWAYWLSLARRHE